MNITIQGVEITLASDKLKDTDEEVCMLNTTIPENCRLLFIKEYINKEIKPKNRARRFICLCKCGNYTIANKYQVLQGHKKSCGCLYKEIRKKGKTAKYYPKIPALQFRYHAMMARCYNPQCVAYKNYGYRGVKVCDEWRLSYQNFLDWAIGNGWHKDLELDKDIKGNGLLYSPATCCWTTRRVNSNNRTKTVKYYFRGEKLSLSEISTKTWIRLGHLFYHIKIKNRTLKETLKIFYSKNTQQ